MIIYKIVNCVNGKIYIGQTIQKLERRMYSHFNRHTKTCISKAIQKYGKENFKYEIIDTAKTREELATNWDSNAIPVDVIEDCINYVLEKEKAGLIQFKTLDNIYYNSIGNDVYNN